MDLKLFYNYFKILDFVGVYLEIFTVDCHGILVIFGMHYIHNVLPALSIYILHVLHPLLLSAECLEKLWKIKW